MELGRRLQADNTAMEKLYRYFGLNLEHRFKFTDLKDLFPDTTVGVLKKCFDALRMYDLAEIVERVRPRSLRPAVSPEQVEKLWRAGDRPTKYHSDVAVLVVNHTVEKDFVKSKTPEKIETFFKDLNSRNEVATISLGCSQETREDLRKIKQRGLNLGFYHAQEHSLKKGLERVFQWKTRLEKELAEVMQMEKEREQKRRLLELELELREAKQQELGYRGQLENIVTEKEQIKREFEKLKELEKESTKPISTAMDDWIHNQGWLTFK